MANSDSSVLQETILRAMDAVVTQRNNELKLDKTVTAIVKKNVGTRNNRPLYEVEYEGGRLVATAQNSTDSYVPNTSVYVLVPQGNFSNEKIIIGRANSISTDRSASVVAAAANSYSIIGANLIESTSSEKIKNIQYGLHSFHDHTTEILGHPSDHRFQVLYDINSNTNRIKFNDNRLNIYKDQTTALMLKADFQTNLDIEQRRQSNARYGLLFNFSFNNLNKGFGETNGEIFENLAPIVEGKVIEYRTIGGQQEFETIDKTLADYHVEISNSDFSNSILNMYIEYIQTLYNNFLINKKKLNTDLISNLVTAYLNLLNELKNIQIDIRKVQYENWWMTQVGEPGQKIEQFVLTSDMMIGNPLSFSQWNTQYTVFTIDMNTFNHVESIYFFKEGFVENEIAESQWPLGNDFTENPYGGPDIFVKNIQIYAMKPLEAQSGDYSLKVEPYGGNDFILSATNPSTQFKATVLRQLYEDLTYNDKTSYYWFKESPAIINSSCDGYNYLAGVGWKYLYHTESKYLFSTTIEENPAYKNNYKCVAVYEPAADNKTILTVTFVVYNEDAAIKMKLESNIGTEFSFDQGIPTIKVLLHNNEMQEEEYAEIGFKQDKSYTINNVIYPADSPKYLYTWAITDSVNGQKIFLADTADDENFLLVSAKQALLDRISHFTSIGYYDNEEEIREVEDTSFATRIKYPVYTTSSGFTIDCYLQERKPVIGGKYKYYNVGSAQLEFINQNENLSSSDFRIQIVNGDQVFQYDEYGNAPTVNKLKEPLEIQPLQAKLISRSGLEIESSNYNVEWIFPIEDTLITTNEILVENSASQLIQSYHARECNFGIQEIYNPNYYNNQITCHISFNNIDLYKDTNFYFGKVGNNGTNGTDVVAKIEYAQTDDVNLLHYEPLTLYVQKGQENKAKFNVRDADGDLNNLQSTKTLVNSSGNSLLKLALYQKNILLGEESYAAGYPRWNIAGNTYTSNLTSTNNTGKFFELNSTLAVDSSGISNVLTWNYNFQNDNKHFRIQNIQAEVKVKTGETYYAYFSLPIIEYEEGQNLHIKLHKDTIAIDKPTYLNEIVYNADGRNPIYNHNAGLKLINLPKGVTVTWRAKGGFNSTENAPSISLLKSKDDKTRWSTYTTPVINDGTAMTYVLPADNFTGRATNNRIEAVVKQGSTVIATVYAPVNMILNTFGLASINAWDGNSITIDENNGAVLAPQMGAGEKDNNNRFTGIVMGKTETYTGGAEKEKQIGLFGYANGLQSIFLDSETGNATFGLPDPDANGKYRNTSRAAGDNYNEGRIELRPGGESKIGGWKIGRRSLYYTMEKKSGSWTYSGKIGNSYNDEWATNHIKDINHEHQGILLDPSYISIKGRPLTVGQGASYDIDDTSGNAALNTGDSLELNLDPNQKSFFTIFRHYKDNEIWKRKPLVGIDALGRFYTNALQDQETSLNMNYVAGFGKTAREEKYVGLNIGYGARTIFKAFINAVNSQENDTLYFSGGKLNNEYIRPLSLHGSSIKLYASNDASISSTPKYNIQISQSSGQINLGDNTGLYLYTSDQSTNSLKTAGPLSVNIGTSNSRKNLTINANTTTAAIAGITITNSGTTTINNTGNVSMTNANSTTLSSKGNITLYRRNNNNEIESELLLRDKDSTAYFGIPTIKDEEETVIRRGYISLSGKETDESTWATLGHIKLTTAKAASQITLNVNEDSTGLGKTGDASSRNATNTQILLQAGTHTRLGLTSSSTHWTGGTGYPFYLEMGSVGKIYTMTQHPSDSKIVNTLMTNLNIQTSKGISITGNLTELDSNNNVITSDYGLVIAKGIQTKSAANLISFGSTNFSGSGKNPSYNNGGYYSVNSLTTLKDAIDNCLKAAGLAKAAADNAESSVTTLRNSLGSAAWASTGDFRSSSWYPDLSGYVDWSTYNGHTHRLTYSTALLNSTLVNAASANVVTVLNNTTGTP